MHPDGRRLPADEDAGTTISVAVRQRGRGHLRGQPDPDVIRQGGHGARRKVAERPGGREQSDDAVRGLGLDSVVRRGRDHLSAVPAPVQQADHRHRGAHPGQRDRPPRVDADLQRVPVAPDPPEARLQRWSHARQGVTASRHSGHEPPGGSRPDNADDSMTGRSPPSPEVTAALRPGDSWLVTLGPPPPGVNTRLWTMLWIIWGERGESLWRPVGDGCELPSSRTGCLCPSWLY